MDAFGDSYGRKRAFIDVLINHGTPDLVADSALYSEDNLQKALGDSA